VLRVEEQTGGEVLSLTSEAGNTPKVSIILVNWNGWQDTISCLDSIFQISYSNYDVIIVDNGSEDESVDMIRAYVDSEVRRKLPRDKRDLVTEPIKSIQYSRHEAELGGVAKKERSLVTFPPDRRLRVILNDTNTGYSDANNVAIRYACKALSPDYILLLNNDTVVDKHFLCELVSVAETDDMIGMTGPKIYYNDFNGRRDVIFFAGGTFDMHRGWPIFRNLDEIDCGQHDTIKEVDQLSGSCLLAKRELLEQVGLLSTDYFLYWEDTDLCFRAHQFGFKLVYVPRAVVWHKVSTSVRKMGCDKVYYMARGRLYFMKRFATKRQLLSFLSYFFFYEFLIQVGTYLRQGETCKLKKFCEGVFDGLFTHRHDG
jgi:GT2 family glycosyltransferase